MLLLIRLVEMKTTHKYSVKTFVNEMKNIIGIYFDEKYYMLDHYNDIIEDFGNALSADLTKRFIHDLGRYLKILADTKK